MRARLRVLVKWRVNWYKGFTTLPDRENDEINRHASASGEPTSSFFETLTKLDVYEIKPASSSLHKHRDHCYALLRHPIKRSEPKNN